MASDREFVAFVCEQLREAGGISSKRMFGEASVYLRDKIVGLVCDNQLFIKPTEVGRALLGKPIESPPFPGASNWFLLADLDDREFLAQLVRATADALPAPKVKIKKSAGRRYAKNLRVGTGEPMAGKYGKAAGDKVRQVMEERKRGTLKSGGSGRTVKSRKQAIAIALSETRRAGKKVPKVPAGKKQQRKTPGKRKTPRKTTK